MTLLTPEFLHNPQYEAIKDRYANLASPPVQEGILSAIGGTGNELAVTQRGAGANMTVDVAAGRALVQGDTVARQGLYHVVNDAAITGSTIAANASGNPRIDQVVLQINDSTDAGAGSDIPTITVLTGTATGGATLDNRTGAATLPNSALRLCDILVANGAASITNTVIRDRRPWARGGHFIGAQASGADYAIAGTSFADIDGTNLKKRIECSGAPIRVSLFGTFAWTATPGVFSLRPAVDGAQVTGLTTDGGFSNLAGNTAYAAQMSWTLTPTAGSHLISLQAKVTTSTFNIQRGTDYDVVFTIEEILRPSAENNTSAGTSG